MINSSNSCVYLGWIITIFFPSLFLVFAAILIFLSTSLLFILDNALGCFLSSSFFSAFLMTGCTKMVHITHAYEYIYAVSRKKEHTRDALLYRD